MAIVGLGSESSPASGSFRSVGSKGICSSGMEVDGDSEETGFGTKEDYPVHLTNDASESDNVPLPPRRRRLLLSTESAFVDNVLPSLVQNPDIELRLITEDRKSVV